MIRLYHNGRHTVLVKADDVSVAVDVRGCVVIMCMRVSVRMLVCVFVCVRVLVRVFVCVRVLVCVHMIVLVILSFFLSAHTYLASESRNITLYTYFICWYIASGIVKKKSAVVKPTALSFANRFLYPKQSKIDIPCCDSGE